MIGVCASAWESMEMTASGEAIDHPTMHSSTCHLYAIHRDIDSAGGISQREQLKAE